MQDRRPLHQTSGPINLFRRAMCLAVSFALAMLCGCSAHIPLYHFAAKSISKISYNPQKCTEMPDGKFLCKDVVFTVNSIEQTK